MKYTPAHYAKTLYELLERETDAKKTQHAVRQFATVLKKHGALSLGERIVRAFERIYYARKKIVRAHITLAKGDLLDNLLRALPKNAEVTASHNPELIGGLQIRIGDTLIDNSIKARIEKLKERLVVL